jgi:ATP-grasp domain, R2K clade family 3
MKLLFCSDPLQPRAPDSAYEAEVAAAETCGLDYALVDYEALVGGGEPQRAIRRVPEQEVPCVGIYRGWMLRPEQYAQLYQALDTRGIQLINSPAAYLHCHYLPESYKVLQGRTPVSAWLRAGPDAPLDQIMEVLAPFDARPVVVKDFVKSRKHEWADACYIPSAGDRAAVARVVQRFLELQGEDLCEGLVFREFVEFEPIGQHPKSGMPLTREYRSFWLDGEPIYWVPYWEGADYGGMIPPVEQFRDVAAAVQSRFFTMDIAKQRNDGWLVVELGDAQVAGLPETADVRAFYEALRAARGDVEPAS